MQWSFVQDGLHIQIENVIAFFIVFGAHTSVFSIVKRKIIVLIKWLYPLLPPPPLCALLRLQWLSYFGHVNQSLLSMCLLGVCFWSHTYPHITQV